MTTTTEQPDQEAVDMRYVYCLVDTDGRSTIDVETQGVDGEPLSLVTQGDIGAVVHDCGAAYDTDDESRIKQWLIEHQRVVDASSDVFGTPLPVRFGTVLEGDDAVVETWLSSRAETIRDHLESFSGCWEYRIDLQWDSEPFRDEVATTDDELLDLERRKTEASAGKGFMLEKQYSNRLRELVSQKEAELRELLDEQVAPVTIETTMRDSGGTAATETDGTPSIAELSVLAEEAKETELGERLDTVAERTGVEIRFSGPWPPYTFAPELG